MRMQELVQGALKEKNPTLYLQLKKSGDLGRYTTDLAEQINSEIVSLTMQDRLVGRWDDLGAMECANRMKVAQSLNQEKVLAEMLEFPQDETSQQSQD